MPAASSPPLAYPADAEEHFEELRAALAPFSQYPGFRSHVAAGCGGPWIENAFIGAFEAMWNARPEGACLMDFFGPFIPLFVPWTDLWVIGVAAHRKPAKSYPPALEKALRRVLRPEVPYVAVVQNDEGLPGHC